MIIADSDFNPVWICKNSTENDPPYSGDDRRPLTMLILCKSNHFRCCLFFRWAISSPPFPWKHVFNFHPVVKKKTERRVFFLGGGSYFVRDARRFALLNRDVTKWKMWKGTGDCRNIHSLVLMHFWKRKGLRVIHELHSLHNTNSFPLMQTRLKTM